MSYRPSRLKILATVTSNVYNCNSAGTDGVSTDELVVDLERLGPLRMVYNVTDSYHFYTYLKICISFPRIVTHGEPLTKCPLLFSVVLQYHLG